MDQDLAIWGKWLHCNAYLAKQGIDAGARFAATSTNRQPDEKNGYQSKGKTQSQLRSRDARAFWYWRCD